MYCKVIEYFAYLQSLEGKFCLGNQTMQLYNCAFVGFSHILVSNIDLFCPKISTREWRLEFSIDSVKYDKKRNNEGECK